MIDVINLDLDLDGKPILRSIDLHVDAGEKVVITGESGSGKTSLLRVLIGMHRPGTGRVSVFDLDLVPENLSRIRSRMFYMPQDVLAVGDETARGFIDMIFSFRATRSRTPSESDMISIFDAFGLGHGLLDSPMGTLSGGERQRVGLVRGLLLGRELLLLDEATSAVDAVNRKRIMNYLLKLKDTTIIAVTHDEVLIEGADRRITMQDGRITEIKKERGGK